MEDEVGIDLANLLTNKFLATIKATIQLGHLIEMGCAATKVSDQQQHDDPNNEGGAEDGGGGVEDGVAVAPVSIEGDATTVESIPVPEGEEKSASHDNMHGPAHA